MFIFLHVVHHDNVHHSCWILTVIQHFVGHVSNDMTHMLSEWLHITNMGEICISISINDEYKQTNKPYWLVFFIKSFQLQCENDRFLCWLLPIYDWCVSMGSIIQWWLNTCHMKYILLIMNRTWTRMSDVSLANTFRCWPMIHDILVQATRRSIRCIYKDNFVTILISCRKIRQTMSMSIISRDFQ
jgi:hypothetical protein